MAKKKKINNKYVKMLERIVNKTYCSGGCVYCEHCYLNDDIKELRSYLELNKEND